MKPSAAERERGMNSELKMTVSGIVPREGKPVAYVQFEDEGRNAEGLVPDCRIIKNEGFAPEDVVLLEVYMKEHLAEIHDAAKKIDAMRGFMK